MSSRPATIVRARRLGGTLGNEILTSATAAVLTVLLAGEGLTILLLGRLRREHMFLGMVLIGPVALKLGSTGYRFVRYYSGDRAYREKGPPELALRLLAPLLVAATAAVLATGVVLMAIGHRSGLMLTLHKASFIVWGLFFAAHFLAHLPRMARTLAREAGRAAGVRARRALLLGSLAAGVALALAVLAPITAWHVGPR